MQYESSEVFSILIFQKVRAGIFKDFKIWMNPMSS